MEIFIYLKKENITNYIIIVSIVPALRSEMLFKNRVYFEIMELIRK